MDTIIQLLKNMKFCLLRGGQNLETGDKLNGLSLLSFTCVLSVALARRSKIDMTGYAIN